MIIKNFIKFFPGDQLDIEQSKEKFDLILIFGDRTILEKENFYDEVTNTFKSNHFFGCSTAGEIINNNALENTVVFTGIKFSNTKIKIIKEKVNSSENSYAAGKKLASKLEQNNLKHLLILSEGVNINGSKLLRGIKSCLSDDVAITGGLAGDYDKFQKTTIIADAPPESNIIAGIGFYGDNIKIGYGSYGGWEPFGPYRLITKSKGNIVYTIDNKPALELYKAYLGKYHKNLPASALFFPLALKSSKGNIVRTVLSINESDGSMTFAGDMPEGKLCRFMKSNLYKLIEGAGIAAQNSISSLDIKNNALAILISCVGRKLLLKQRSSEEIEEVSNILGKNTYITGFYSYGEFSPFKFGEKSKLHNQTMTITVLYETNT